MQKLYKKLFLDSERNKKAEANMRGGYAYAEIIGPYGLIQIDSINGEKVGIEIGMTNQVLFSKFYYLQRSNKILGF